MEVQNPKAAEDAIGRGFADKLSGFAVKSCILSVAEGLKGVGDRERETNEGLAVDFALSFGCEEADIDVVGCMLIARLGKDSGEVVGRRGLALLKQGAIERGGVRDEKAEVACGEASRQLESDADVARRLMPGAESGLDFDGVSGMSDVGGGDARLIESDRDLTGNGLNAQIDGANDALSRAV